MAKSRQILFLVIVVFILASFSFCISISYKEYECNVQKIKSIEIIRLGEWPQEEGRDDYTVLATVTDCVDFGNRLNELKYSVIFGTPYVFTSGDVVVKIDYADGDYDYINKTTQLFYRSGKYDYGCYVFNDKQFDALMSEYYTE